MTYRIVRYDPTPNPNALKCWLDRPISDRPRSFLNAAAAADDPLAAALFTEGGATNILMNGEWMTVSKAPDDGWPTIKRKVEAVLAAAGG